MKQAGPLTHDTDPVMSMIMFIRSDVTSCHPKIWPGNKWNGINDALVPERQGRWRGKLRDQFGLVFSLWVVRVGVAITALKKRILSGILGVSMAFPLL